jgi:hypothetical protein
MPPRLRFREPTVLHRGDHFAAVRCRRGSPIRAGWNSAVQARVQESESANSRPMLEMPGLLENQSTAC